jgi:gliding motility-associated-like protein
VLCHSGTTGSATATVSGGSGPGSYTYSWTPSGGTAALAVGLAANTYTCTIQDAHTCSAVQTYTITQPTVITSTSSVVPATCTLANGSVSVQPSGGTGPGTYTYSWSSAGGTAPTAGSLFANTYTCTITDANGCIKTVPVVLNNIGIPPAALITASGPLSFCPSSSVSLIASGGTSYSWNTGATTNVISVNTAGVYTLHATTMCGTDSFQVVVTILPLPVPAISGATTICKGDSSKLTATGGGVYTWSTGQTGPFIYAKTGGNYTVSTSNGCGAASASTTILVDNILANFTVSADTGTQPFTVVFSDHSSPNVNTWSWTFGDGSTGTGQPIEHTYTAWGNDTAWLTVTDPLGCKKDTMLLIHILDGASFLHIPNVFTPNGDGVNDTWYLDMANMKTLHGEIVDRWGVIMTRLDGPGQAWDGRTITGEPAFPGTYFYDLVATGADGKSYTLHGFITLMR